MKMLCLEGKRTERSGRRFVLMQLDLGGLLVNDEEERILQSVLSAVSESTRDTDVKGWQRAGRVIGVIFTEIGGGEGKAVVQALRGKITTALYSILTIEQVNKVGVSFHLYPEDWDEDDGGVGSPVAPALRLALSETDQSGIEVRLKRLMDIVGSAAALIGGIPIFLMIAIAIKLTSKGPVLYRQKRVGQFGKRFTFLKFRSMYTDNDPSIHREFVARFIAGSSDVEQLSGDDRHKYKLAADPRVTPVGRILRKTSLDELPQFWHVLTGKMSLVGPRPPVTYEVDRYALWHKRRLLSVKPGITGLWQVKGRSRVKFEDMVRLDIHYARTWSLWLDIRILLKTPSAAFDGAC